MTSFKKILLLFACIGFYYPLAAQDVLKHVSYTDIYDFLDELANAKIITINSAIKPYSRVFIAEKLNESLEKKELLNNRQLADLNFYLKDYYKELERDTKTTRWLLGKKDASKRYDLFYYNDLLFSMTVNPIIGYSYFNNDSGDLKRSWNGVEIFGYVGKGFGYYASLRDNHESPLPLASPSYLNQYSGVDYKRIEKGQFDHDEMRGGISYVWKWGSIGLIKDHFVWGDNQNGANIFSGHAPSFTHLRLHVKPVKWLDFSYVNGWLISNLVDSSKIYYSNGTLNRIVYRPKYLAANMVTVTPIKGLDFSIGNSIVYGDQINPGYLIPIMFYKSLDHELATAVSNLVGQNSQMYFNISSRNIKNLHLYTSWYVDEISFSNALDPNKQSNLISAKFGARFSNFVIPNLFLGAEYTRTNPITYRHYVLITTFENDNYNLGHFLGDNAQDIYFSLGYKPLAKLYIEASYDLSQKGEEYPYNGTSSGSGHGNPFLKEVLWQAETMTLKANYQVLNDCYLFASFSNSDHSGPKRFSYSMPYFIGKQNTINIGANIGF